MIKPLNVFILCFMALLAACNPTELTGKGVSSNVIINDGSYDNKAFIYPDSPYYIAGPHYGPANVNMDSVLSPEPEFITNNTNLSANCSMTFFFYSVAINEPCIKSLSKSTSITPVARNSDRTFIYPTHSPEFYQTNALYHIAKGTNYFFKKLTFAYEQVHTMPSNVPKSLPSYLVNSKLFWFKAMASPDKKLFRTDFLTSYAQCELDKNAQFSPVGPELCFGGHSEIPGFYFVQDPDIIYHELGHALVSIMMNTRNGVTTTDHHNFRSNLGGYGYSEAGAINEGIADYYTYLMTFRAGDSERRFSEFALGKAANQSRPYSESHPVHIPSIDESSAGRLSYPHFLHYDPNDPGSIYEDVHYAGQIVTHYLVALTKNLKTKCSMPSDANLAHDRVSSYVMLLLAETLSEIGDLNAKGIDLGGFPYLTPGVFFNNMDKTNSYLWTQVINKVSYRRFFQVFGKNINKYISGRLCPGFDKNNSERLLDDYGLLLFKTYNDNGNSTKNRATTYGSIDPNLIGQPLTKVYEDNRRKSVLVSKELVGVATRTDQYPNRRGYFVIDNNSDIKGFLEDLLFKGFAVPLSTGVSSPVYNNNNVAISPGEVVAIIPNILNNSNTTIAGVQILATDWDHVHIPTEKRSSGNFKPCVVDTATTVDQGGESGETCTSTFTEYNRLIYNPLTQVYPAEAVAPVCLVQLEEGNSARWVSQNEFRKKQGLALMEKDCLGYSTTGNSDPDFTFTPHECLARFLPGANSATLSKIDAQKTHYETVVKDSGSGKFDPGSLLLMEVNKWIPPGTKFRCRLRVKFSNCSDCYADSGNGNDDYLDAELNGAKPFKVINFDFEVNE